MELNPAFNLLLKGMVGSKAFGLANENSDEDFIGIFGAPTVMFHGLGQVQESFSYKDPDTTYHEVGKYCKLALKCNPTILDLLWLEEYTIDTHLGIQLVTLRDNFLSYKYVKNAYFGYAVSQLGKLGKDPRPEKRSKNARHFLRLLNHGFDLFTEGTYSVRLQDPEKYIVLGNQIGANGDVDLAKDILARYEKWFEISNSVLPEKPNPEPIEAWLLKVRYELYRYRYQDTFKNLE